MGPVSILRAFFMLLALCAGQAVHAQTLTLYTENDPPYNFLGPDGKATGLAVEVVQEIQQRLGTSEVIQFVPWARAYNAGLRQPNTVVFTMARTTERNPLFHWIGPINDNAWVLLAKSDSKTQVRVLDDARQLKRIGVYREDSRDQYLTQLGFTNLERSNSNINILRMLMAGRVDAVAMADATVADAVKEAELQSSDLRELLSFKTVQVYIAMSKGTSPERVAQWNGAFAAMLKDGSFKRIFGKYFAKKKMPGLAVEPT